VREAAQAYRQALDVALELEAPWHALRAAIGLARALRSEGATEEAGSVLQRALAGMPAGEGSEEATEARELLQALV